MNNGTYIEHGPFGTNTPMFYKIHLKYVSTHSLIIHLPLPKPLQPTPPPLPHTHRHTFLSPCPLTQQPLSFTIPILILIDFSNRLQSQSLIFIILQDILMARGRLRQQRFQATFTTQFR